MQSKVHWKKRSKDGNWQVASYFDPPVLETRLEQLTESGEVIQSVVVPDESAVGISTALQAAEKTRNGWRGELRRIRAEMRVNAVKRIRDL